MRRSVEDLFALMGSRVATWGIAHHSLSSMYRDYLSAAYALDFLESGGRREGQNGNGQSHSRLGC